MKYTQDRFSEITQNNPNKLKASEGVFPSGSAQHIHSRPTYFHTGNLFGEPFIVDWQLSVEDRKAKW